MWGDLNRKMKEKILIFVYSIALYLIIGVPSKACVGLIGSSVVETICYAIMTYLFSKKAKTTTDIFLIGGTIILGRVILEIPVRIMDWEETLISFPTTVLACITIVLTVVISVLRKNKYVTIFAVSLWGYSVLFWHKSWLESLTWGPTSETSVVFCAVNTPKGNVLLDSISSEYILLDFWNSRCSICYEKFPELQSLFERAEKSQKKITVASVFVPFKDEQERSGDSIIRKIGYTFPVWSVSRLDTLLKLLEIRKYPTAIILDEDKNVLFKGHLEKATEQLESYID